MSLSLRTIGLPALVGVFVAAIWSFHFVDSVIGDNVANGLLGYDAKAAPITSLLAGALFAFVTGIAGTFTACNVCVVSCVAPVAGRAPSPLAVLQPLGSMLAGALLVSILYGSLGVLAGPMLPVINNEPVLGFYQGRLAQATVVYVLIGSLMVYWGIRRIVPAPFTMGLVLGAFLIGRPFPLFRKMFEYAVSTGDPAYGAMTFALQSIGNMLIVTLIILGLVTWGGRLLGWMHRNAATIASCGFIGGGAFLLFYWGVRIPLRFGTSFGW